MRSDIRRKRSVIGELITYVLLIFGCLLIQSAILKPLLPAGLVPNLLIVVVVYLAFFNSMPGGAVIAFMLGLALDMVSGTLLGPWAGAFVVVYLVYATVSQRIFCESSIVFAVASFIAAILAAGVYCALTAYVPFEHGLEWVGSAILRSALLEGVGTALFAPFLFFVLVRFLCPPTKG